VPDVEATAKRNLITLAAVLLTGFFLLLLSEEVGHLRSVVFLVLCVKMRSWIDAAQC